jgi:FKBP-type peptidyl-prolyl cis-trans isomerase
MTNLKTLLALAALTSLAACTQPTGDAASDATAVEPAALTLDSSEKRLSYAIAYGLGERLKADGVPVDVAAFSEGMRHGLEGAEPELTQEEMGGEMQAFQSQQGAERQAREAAAAESNLAAGAAFLAENAGKEGVTVTGSGLQYKVLQAGDGPVPTPEDTVEVHYRGTLIDGTEFDSSYKRGSTVTFGVTQVIGGWTEALQLMPVGSKWELFIPAELAYGAAGAGPVIGPNSTLVFEVELVGIAPR